MSYGGVRPLKRGDSLRSTLFRMPNIQGGASRPGLGFFCFPSLRAKRGNPENKSTALLSKRSNIFCLSGCLLPPPPPLRGGGAKRRETCVRQASLRQASPSERGCPQGGGVCRCVYSPLPPSQRGRSEAWQSIAAVISGWLRSSQ